MNLEPPVALGYWLVFSYGVQKISIVMIHFADVVFCKKLSQISIDFRNHQSTNWFYNFVILAPILSDLDKKITSKNIHFQRYIPWRFLLSICPYLFLCVNVAHQCHAIAPPLCKEYVTTHSTCIHFLIGLSKMVLSSFNVLLMSLSVTLQWTPLQSMSRLGLFYQSHSSLGYVCDIVPMQPLLDLGIYCHLTASGWTPLSIHFSGWIFFVMLLAMKILSEEAFCGNSLSCQVLSLQKNVTSLIWNGIELFQAFCSILPDKEELVVCYQC